MVADATATALVQEMVPQAGGALTDDLTSRRKDAARGNSDGKQQNSVPDPAELRLLPISPGREAAVLSPQLGRTLVTDGDGRFGQAGGLWVALEVVEWSSTEPDAAFAAINAVYGPDSRLRHWGDPAGFSCRYSTATSGDVGADRCITSMSSGGTVAPLGFFMSSTVISGAIADFRVRGRAFGIAQGATVLTGARSAIELTWTAGDLAALRLPWVVIDRIAD